MPFFQRRRGGSGGFGVALLAMQLFNFGFDRIPPVTLVTILGQMAIFLGFGDLRAWFPSSLDVCISSHLVVKQGQWRRLILGSLYHSNDMHLYYNMVSLLWKGSVLEKKFKSVYYGYLLIVFTCLTSIVLVGLNMLMAEVFGDQSYQLQCAVGFSGVLFALKVLTTHYSPPGLHYALGFIPVPSKYIYWAELGIIQLLVPNASFTGHLAGILVGLLYVKGPLKTIMDGFMSPEPSYTYTQRNTGYRQSPGYTTGYQRYPPPDTGNQGYTTGGPSAPYEEDNHNDRYDEYTGGLSEEDQIRRATEESQADRTRSTGRARSSGSNLYPDLDELRQRRSDRYN